MADEKQVYSLSIEGLLVRALEGKITPQLKAALRDIGIDLDRPLLPAYPAETFDKAIEICARMVFPQLPVDKARWELGVLSASGWTRTLAGKAMAGLSKWLGPKRVLMQLPLSAKSSNNYIHLDVKDQGRNEVELSAAPFVGEPDFMAGSMAAVVKMTGGRNPNVEIASRTGDQVVFRIRWA